MSSIVSFTLGVVEYLRDRKTEGWIFTVIACLFLIVAFDAAWQDEHRNASVLIAEKANATGEREFWKNQSYEKDASLRKLDELLTKNSGVLAKTQDSMVSLANKLVGLGKLQPTRTRTFMASIPDAPNLLAIVITVNNPTVMRGDLECTAPFQLVGGGGDTMRSGDDSFNLLVSPANSMIAPNKLRISKAFPLWNPSEPIFVVIKPQKGLGNCEFRLF